MCGITGIKNFDSQCVPPDILAKMTRMLKHRGPDGEGFYIKDNIGFGHRRLKIIDLSERGRQPLSNENDTIWITFNGEIYNFQSISDILKKRGHVFKSCTDSEVIIHAYEEWGIQCLERLNGIFAFALYDERDKTLFLVRDRLGVKPLFYYKSQNYFLFASEIKAILAYPNVPREINETCLHNYFSLNYVTAPLTLFKNIFQVMPGNYLKINAGNCEINSYWDVSFVENCAEKRSDNEWLEGFDYQLRKAVQRQIVSDVPFGVFLSGGLDSSSIAYYMKNLMNTKVKTFSIGFEEKSFNELSDAELVARHLETEHYSKVVIPKIDENFIKKIIWHSEEPTADSSMIPMYFLSEMAHSQVSMVLSGDGADEILAGYETYQAYYLRKLYRFIPRFLRVNVIKKMIDILPASMSKVSLDYKLKTFVRGAELSWMEAHFYWRVIFDEQFKRLLYNEEFSKQIGSYTTFDFIKPYFGKAGKSVLNAMLEVDTKFYLPNDMLVKVDRASMAHSLEARVPFLDHELVEFVAKMPERLKLNNYFQKKFMLKHVMKNRLPRKILQKKKEGFNVPINVWIQGPLKEMVLDTLSTRNLEKIGIFNTQFIQRLIYQHIKGECDFSFQIWSLLIFVNWWNMFIDTGNESFAV
ncbi:MAG: asparagine synthase (glutamine-hydrolyzing) [bacterium]|nr:asparagine synthase (glutamine-hydrolyzing) [bacterium]